MLRSLSRPTGALKLIGPLHDLLANHLTGQKSEAKFVTVATAGNPPFLAVSPDKKFEYTVH